MTSFPCKSPRGCFVVGFLPHLSLIGVLSKSQLKNLQAQKKGIVAQKLAIDYHLSLTKPLQTWQIAIFTVHIYIYMCVYVNLDIHIYICICKLRYIYIYIHREREREREITILISCHLMFFLHL